jgi:glutathione S-transferase
VTRGLRAGADLAFAIASIAGDSDGRHRAACPSRRETSGVPNEPEDASRKEGAKVITLYHCSLARSFRPLWTLEELDLGYELKMLPFPPRVLAPDYLQRNPLGTIPLLLDGETRMTESAAICQYLVTRYGPTALAVAPQEPAYGAYLNWLHFGEATLTFPQTIVLRYSRLEPPERRYPQVVEDYTRWFFARLRALDAALASEPYVCAGRFTAADISVGFALILADQVDLSARFSPRITDYWRRLTARDGFRRARAAEERAGAEQHVPPTVLKRS